MDPSSVGRPVLVGAIGIEKLDDNALLFRINGSEKWRARLLREKADWITEVRLFEFDYQFIAALSLCCSVIEVGNSFVAVLTSGTRIKPVALPMTVKQADSHGIHFIGIWTHDRVIGE